MFPETFMELTLRLPNILRVALLTLDEVDEVFGMVRYVVSYFTCFVYGEKSNSFGLLGEMSK